MIKRLQNISVELPRWFLLGLLILAPWAYGSAHPREKFLLSLGLLATFGFFLLSMAAKPRWPRFNLFSVLLTGLLLLQGWIMVLNPKQQFESAPFAFTNVTGGIPWLPGVVDQAIAQSQLLLVTGLMGAFWIAGDMAASSRWRMRTRWAVSLTGVSLVALGLAQRMTGAKAVFWESYTDSGPTFFATYRYHGNAGAFVNLVLPFMAVQAVLSLRRNSAASKVFWCVATLTTVAAAFVNVSKAAMVITLLILLALAFQQLSQGESRTGARIKRIVLGAVFVALLGGLIWAFGFADSLNRWTELSNSTSPNSRWLVDQAIVAYALPASGWWGFGPGTFEITFPFFSNQLGDSAPGIWQNAHEDYLQGLMEWGYLGGALWAALIFVGFGMAIARHLRRRRLWDPELRLFSSACTISMGGLLLHAAVDFPLQIPSLQLYAAVILGFLWNLPGAQERRKRISKTDFGQKASANGIKPQVAQPEVFHHAKERKIIC